MTPPSHVPTPSLHLWPLLHLWPSPTCGPSSTCGPSPTCGPPPDLPPYTHPLASPPPVAPPPALLTLFSQCLSDVIVRPPFSPFHTQLADTRSPQDPSITLIHYVAKVVRETYPQALSFAGELIYIEKASAGNLTPTITLADHSPHPHYHYNRSLSL